MTQQHVATLPPHTPPALTPAKNHGHHNGAHNGHGHNGAHNSHGHNGHGHNGGHYSHNGAHNGHGHNGGHNSHSHNPWNHEIERKREQIHLATQNAERYKDARNHFLEQAKNSPMLGWFYRSKAGRAHRHYVTYARRSKQHAHQLRTLERRKHKNAIKLQHDAWAQKYRSSRYAGAREPVRRLRGFLSSIF